MTKAQERNPRTKAWTLRGRESDLIRMRDVVGLTFAEMGASLGVTGEAARAAYHRAKDKSPAADTDGASDPTPHEGANPLQDTALPTP